MRLPKYRRHSSGRAFVEHAGKRHYLVGPHGSLESVAAYKAFIREVCGGVISSDPSRPKPSTIAGLIEAWLSWAEVYYGGQGAYTNAWHAIRPLLTQCGSYRVDDFGPLRLKTIQQVLLTQDKSRDYINRATAVTKRMFKWAVSEELLPPAAYQAIATVPGLRFGRTSARESTPRQPVPWEHVLPMLSHVSETIRCMVLVQWYTGVRPQSVCLAKPEQFKLDSEPWEWRPRHKMEYRQQVLLVFVGPLARGILKERIESTPPSQYLFKPDDARKNKRYGAFYRRNSYAQAISRGVERTNKQREIENALMPVDQRRPLIPDWTPHQLRHAKATAVRAKHGLEAAQALLGHGSIDATEIYAQRQAGIASRIAEEEG